ncbi:hypothetical protein [Sporosarcina sp. YIM B06819]|uniref:hypothetical protein n=1 Tax=Sporosarcina sp. YIM B06819 TaxID=3081769 RepID=UPI00298CB188|nr:hypothetical protein [Sporosarcina sp. YIM B06819]
MADAKLYSAQDIENLKQKIATYRDTLTTLKSGNTIDDYLFMKSELTGFKMQASHLEEVMGRLNDKRSMQIEEYEQQIETVSKQIGSLNQTVEELNKDLSVVMDQLINERTENVNTSVDMQDSVNTKHNADERDVIEVTSQLEEKIPISSIQQPNRPPSYKYLQSLIARPHDIQEVPGTVTPTASIHQKAGKPSFPSIGSHPNQIYNGLNRNINMKSTVRFNNISTKQASPTRSDNLVPSIPKATTEPEKNEVVTVSLEELPNLATIEEKVPHIEKIEEKIQHVDKIEREMNPEASIEISNEMKRQQHKNKETLSLFNFFRRKP